MSQHNESMGMRSKGVIYLLIVVFLFFILDLAVIQLVRGGILARQARDQRTEILYRTPLRGIIFDRNMQVLAGVFYRPAFIVFPELIEDRVGMERFLAAFPPNYTNIYTNIDQTSFQSIPPEILNDPGIATIMQPVRYDPKQLATHVIGYLNTSNITGISGIEKTCDSYLRSGNTGIIASFIDARRMPYKGLGVRWVQDGEGPMSNIVLTIDRNIQKIVEEAMDTSISKGAIVIMDPRNGEILAMASRPSFSPNDISDSINMSSSPMINRAISSYPAGSILKTVVAAYGLEKDIVTLSDKFYDPGFIDVGSLRFNCYLHPSGGHGWISFLDAMAYSCNPVFIEIALKIGGKNLLDFYETLGFGATTGVGLPFEQPGNLFSPHCISPQDTANMAIGQGKILVTPLQVAKLFSIIANGGKNVSPRLIAKIESRAGELVKHLEPAIQERILSQDTCRQITFMLESVTRWGTAKSGWVDNYGSCGKTGTAETGHTQLDGSPIYHAWFGGFTPLENPLFVIVVFVEEGGSGGDVASPIFKAIADKLLQ